MPLLINPYALKVLNLNVYLDTFNNPATASNYVSQQRGDTVWTISNGRLTATGASDSQAVYINETAGDFADGYVEAELSQANNAGLVLRYQGLGNYYMMVISDNADSTGSQNFVTLYYRAGGGAFVQLGPIHTLSPAFVRGTKNKFRFEAVGSTLRCYYNGVQLGSDLTNTTFTHGKSGMRHYGPGSSVFGSFAVNTPAVDGPAFYNAMMAQGPIHYYRNGESSGTVMMNEVGTNGGYSPGISLGNTPLYPTGLTSVGGNFSSSVLGATAVGSIPSSLTAMTLITIVRPTDLTGVHMIGFSADNGVSQRKFQWRSNGTDIEFVKIPGSVVTITAPSMLATNTTYLLGFEVDASGNYAMYRNGVQVKTGTITAGTNYGGVDQFSLGYSTGASANFEGTTCDNAIFDKVLGPSVHSALFAATGL